MPKLKNWGGARAGAGRPIVGKGKRQITTIALEPVLLAALERRAKLTGLSRNELVNRLLSERLLSDNQESVQMPLIDTPAPPADDFEQALAALDAEPELTPRPALAPCLADWLAMPPSDFGQSLANELELRPVKRGAFDWSLVKGNEAIEQELKRLTKPYGKRFVELLTSGRTDIKPPPRLKEICDMSERARRCSLLELAGITF